jgi:CHASE3 domain sensor protein
MGNIERRLGNLERLSASRHADKSGSPRYLDSYFRALENVSREKAGLPALPYTEEDRQDDEEFLRETLPVYRASLGWQTEEAQHVLDIWERDTIEKLQKGIP